MVTTFGLLVVGGEENETVLLGDDVEGEGEASRARGEAPSAGAKPTGLVVLGSATMIDSYLVFQLSMNLE